MERLPAHLRGTGIETLEGMEHIHVVVEARPYGMHQALRLPLEAEAQALPFLGAPIPEDDEAERQGYHQRQAHREPPAVPDGAGFSEPAQHQRRGDEDAECVPHPPRPPRHDEQRPRDLAADRQGRDADSGTHQAAEWSSQQQKGARCRGYG